MECPFGCAGWKAETDYAMMLHMETLHNEEDDAPSAIDAGFAIDDREDARYAICPMENCGENVLLRELSSHIEMHEIEAEGGDDPVMREEAPSAIRAKLPERQKRSRNQSSDEGKGRSVRSNGGHGGESAASAWKRIFMSKRSTAMKSTRPKSSVATNTGPKQLGVKELGPHHREEKMPEWLFDLLQSDGEWKELVVKDKKSGRERRTMVPTNYQPGVVDVIDQLLEQDPRTQYAYLCHPAVSHVSKLSGEGGFCGYRNIQMLSSWIVNTESQGHPHFNRNIPSIFTIQDHIEHAWDLGINASGRIETGGIKGTRKYIGTPDAQAMFTSLDIACRAVAYKAKTGDSESASHDLLLTAIETYFANNCPALEQDSKVRHTIMPPIYFQHRGHSMTIIGFEMKKDGSKNLLVFDPMFHDSKSVTDNVDRKNVQFKAPQQLLKAYRRGVTYLRRYKEFEVLMLTPPRIH